MKKLFTVIAAVFCFSILYSHRSRGAVDYEFDPGSGWVQKTELLEIVDSHWTKKDNDEVYLGVMSHSNSTIGNSITQENLPQSVKSFSKGRQALLQLQGITDWNVKDFSLSENDAFKILHLEGAYTTHGGRIHFREDHYFIDKRYYSVSLLYPENSSFATSKESNEILKTFKVSARGGAAL